MKRFPLFLSLALLLAGCAPKAFVCKDGTQVRLTAITEDIIRVEAVPAGAAFGTAESLIVLKQDSAPEASVSEDASSATVETARLRAVLDKETGCVSFYSVPDGELLSCENRREFSPIEVDGCKAWTVRQVFESAPDEGFYGLGQHQADEWNYKGRNEELYQYNTKISVPFVVSSKRYGILWDSYSFCRWGDPRDYAQLGEVFKLYDKDGAEGGLTGTYTPAHGEPLVRLETALGQEFLRTPQCDVVKGSPEGFNFGGSHVTYDGWIEPAESGLFHFYLYYAGYTKVSIGGKQVMPEIWRTAWNPNGRKFQLELEKGVKYPLHIDWDPDGGVSYNALKVLSPVAPEEQARMSWWGEMQDEIDYYFIAADSIDGVIGGYRALTGKSQIIPKWALGYWQSRERYTSQDQIVGVMKEFRERGVPVDNIVQDWQYWKDDQWGSHEFDEARYPDPKQMVDDIHALDGRYMISVWPKFYEGTEHFEEMDAKGWIYRTAIDEKVIDWLGYSQSFYDAYDPDARTLFWQQMKDHLYPIGVDAWWMDASEPNIHDCTDMDYRKKMCGPTALGPSTKYFNAYALMNAQAFYEGQRASDDRRVFLLTRNGFAGLQRYSTASWSGDIGTRWEEMKAQISAGLNYSISGIPIWGQDVGGFTVENRYVAAQQLFDKTGKVNEDLKEWRELQARWHEWGIYCPLYRAHGQWPAREPWNIAPKGDPAYEAIVASDNMRYVMMPYLYSLAARVHFEDYTMMRPLVMDFPDDHVARETGDEFLCGDAILVCPVYEYKARSREVYLPEGVWYDQGADLKAIEGGRTITAPAPFGSIPVYFRGGQIMPTGKAVKSTAEVQDEIGIAVYCGGNADFTIYEDDGTTYAYERGEFSRIPLHWDEASQTLTVGAREGSYPGMLEKRTMTARKVDGTGANKSVSFEYDGTAQSIVL